MRVPSARLVSRLFPIAIAVLACGAAACDPCPLRLIAVREFTGTLQPGAFAYHDVTLPDEDGLHIDASNARMGTAGRVDVWLAPATCARLFDDPYPLPSGAIPAARCGVIAGPVVAGSVSARAKAEPGAYRLFTQAWTTNSGAMEYGASVGWWGQTCRGGPTVVR